MTTAAEPSPTPVTVRLFALFREQAGQGELQLSVPAGSQVRDLMSELARRFPSLTHLAVGAVAVNQVYASYDHALEAGDEVAFIPPVAGG